MNIAYNVDCMEYMATLPDNAFDLAVVDPPYGDGHSQSVHVEREREWNRFGGLFDRYKTNSQGGVAREENIRKKTIAWDIAPGEEYFKELFRVSRNQVIWGGNYFQLPPSRCFLVWRKTNIPVKGFSMAPCEYAWTSFLENAKMFEFSSAGSVKDKRFHPTQKPVELYEWVYRQFSKPDQKILDTHLGSGSSRIAAYKMGLDFVGCEIDPDYFKAQEERFENYTNQTSLFHMEEL